MLNGSDSNCTLYKNLKYETWIVRRLFEYLAPIILILGIIGNSLGLYCAMKDKIIYVRVYLTRVFHAVNLFNYIFMFLYPIFDSLSHFYLAPLVNRLPWNKYLVYYHFPMAKTFVNFSFGIYVIFGITQMIAIVYPHHYKQYFTLRKIKIMMSISFFYYFVWYIPSAWWFNILELKNVCGFDPKLIIFTRIFAGYTNSTVRVGWIIFGFLREIFTRFIPIGIILVLNYFSLKHTRLMLSWRSKNAVSNLQVATRVKVSVAAVLPEFEKSISIKTQETDVKEKLPSRIPVAESSKLEYKIDSIHRASNKSSVDGDLKHIPDIIDVNKIKIGLKADSQNLGKIKQRELEYKLSIRMLAILMIEFVVFLFPVSIYIITVDFYDYLLTPGESEIAFAGCTLLEYSYISLTFYLNMIFNPVYRKDACRNLGDSKLGKIFNKIYKKINRS
ncbi:unnamed protein product [Gordionus sp. m RMFG-2023]